MSNDTTCNVSETALQRAKRRMLAVGLSLPIFFVLFFLLNPLSQDSSGCVMGAMIFMLVVIEAIIIVESTILLQKMKEMTLTISSEGIERAGGRYTEKISFSDILKAAITEYPSGQVASVKLAVRDSKPVSLQGFEQMEWIAQQIEAAIPDKSMIQRKRQSIDWDNPWLLVAMIMLLIFVVLLIQRLDSGIIFRIVNFVFLITYGLVTLVSRPISRSLGKRFEKFEIVLGIFLTLIGIVTGFGLLAQFIIS
jgi:hypothetical protein